MEVTNEANSAEVLSCVRLFFMPAFTLQTINILKNYILEYKNVMDYNLTKRQQSRR